MKGYLAALRALGLATLVFTAGGAGADVRPQEATSAAAGSPASGPGVNPDTGSSGGTSQHSTLQLAPGLATAPAATGSLAETPVLDYAKALDTVWSNSPEVIQAQLALRATDFDVSGSRAGYYPFVAVQAEQEEGEGTTSVLRIVQPLWDGGLTKAQVDRAKAQRMRALAQLNSVRLDIGLRTSEAYLNVVTAEEMNRQWQAYVASLEELLNVVRRRAEQGLAPQADEQTALTRLSEARAGAEANRATLVANRAQLESLLLQPAGAVAWPGDHQLLDGVEASAAGRVGIEAHPQRQLAQAQIQEQEAIARAGKAALWPQLALEHREQIDGFVVDPNNDNATLLVMQYQTDNTLRGFRAYQAENQRIDSARASLQAAIRQVTAAIDIARAERTSARLQIVAQEAASTSAKDLVESFRRQFEVGRKSWLELLNAHREANQLQVQSIAVRRSYWLANARLALQSLQWRRLSARAPSVDVIQDD